MARVDGEDQLQRLAGACRFLSRALIALIATIAVTALLLAADGLGWIPRLEWGPFATVVGILGVPVAVVLAGLARTASILWGGSVAAGILACSIPMPLVAPVALVYAVMVSRRRLADGGVTPSSCVLFRR